MILFGMIIPFLLILIRYAAILIFGNQYEMYSDYQWTKFKVDYSKSYESFEDELHHYKIFQNALKEIDEHNRKYEAGIVTWKKGINKFSDLSEEEFKESGLINPKYLEDSKVESRFLKHNSYVMNGSAPDSIDWRDFGVVTPVRNQGKCGSCWAVATIGAVESHYAIKNAKLTEFSVQELLDCDRESYNKGCSGGATIVALDYAVEHGLDTEESYPYEAEDGTCRKTESKAKLSGWTRLQNGEEMLKDAVGTVGPIVIDIELAQMKSYEKGIYKCWEDERVDTLHSVLLVGYGEKDGVPYWLLKNSWGTDWGEKGYFRLERVDSEPNCRIFSRPCYPHVEIDEGKEEND